MSGNNGLTKKSFFSEAVTRIPLADRPARRASARTRGGWRWHRYPVPCWTDFQGGVSVN